MVNELQQYSPRALSRVTDFFLSGGTHNLVEDVLYCRTWNVAATDNALWCNQFKSLFAAKGSLEPQEVPVGFWYETFKAFIDIQGKSEAGRLYFLVIKLVQQ